LTDLELLKGGGHRWFGCGAKASGGTRFRTRVFALDAKLIAQINQV